MLWGGCFGRAWLGDFRNIPAGINDKVYEYEYDPEGNVTKMTDPDGKATRYEYYRDNLLYRVIIERPAQSDQIFTYTYDPAGRLDKIVYPTSTGIEAVFRNEADLTATGIGTGFDPNGNLRFLRYQKTNGDLIRRFEYSYDDSNNRASLLEERADGSAVKWEYFYDWLDRLKTVKSATAASVGALPASLPTITVYSYDESDNRIGLRLEQEDLTYRYELDEADNLKKIFRQEGSNPEVLIETIESDPDGNMISRTNEITGEIIHYEWSGFDRLLKVRSEDNGVPTSTVKEFNRYDINGIRKRKMDKNGNGSSEFAASLSTQTSKPLTSTSAAPVLSYVMGHQILGAEVNGNFQFFLPDALGTVRDVVDDSGDVIQSYEFNEHGLPMVGSGAGSGTFSLKTYQGGLSVNDDRNDSGLYLMGHRHYAAELGRFVSRDPIGFRGGLNLFNGAGTNPVTFVDPMGLSEGGPSDHPNEILYQRLKAQSERAWKQQHEERFRRLNAEFACKYQAGLDLGEDFVASRRPDLAKYFKAANGAKPMLGSPLLDLVGANMVTSFDGSTISVSWDTMDSLYPPEFIAWNILHEGVHVTRGPGWNTLHPRYKETEAYRIINDDVLSEITRFSFEQQKRMRAKNCK